MIFDQRLSGSSGQVSVTPVGGNQNDVFRSTGIACFGRCTELRGS